MLTDSEKRWLRGKELAPRAYCVWCYKFDLCGMTCKAGWCPTDYTPADDFEARVAALLAEIMPKALADPWFIENAKHISADATLKWARLSIEEDMDAEMDK